MSTRMQQRRSPANDWSTANPILAAGEIGFETDTNKFKIGDGVNHWSDLSYFDNASNIGGSLEGYVPLSSVGANDGVASLDSSGNVPFSQLGNIVDGAPGVLDTLNEIAAALGDDANYASTITTALGLKAPLSSPALTGIPTAPTATAGTNTTQISTTAFVKTAIDALKTVDIEEDTNLYFTDQRAVDAVTYAISHGLSVTLDGGTP